MKRVLTDKKLASQAFSCEEALSQTLVSAMTKGVPADKSLASLFRAERKFGSRDRALVSMSVFAVFRWWGWLSPLAGEGFRKDCARLLLAACAAESAQPPEAVAAWACDAGIAPSAALSLFKGKDAQSRASLALSLFGMPPARELQKEGLIPKWAPVEFEEAAAKPELFDWLQQRPPIWLRAQTGTLEELVKSFKKAGLEPQFHPVLKTAFKLQGVKVNLHELDSFKKGLFEIQDISSQCIGLACLPKPGEMWWDSCAGAGGKSLQLADLMQRKGSVRASDTRAYKLDDLKKRAARAAFPNIRISPWDGSSPDTKHHAAFDGVLVDSPCSSSGRWRRNPDARWIADSNWIDELCETQLKILDATSKAVKPGGVLVYATCSFFRREDSGNVERFLKLHPEFSLEPFPNPLTGQLTEGTLLTLPWAADCDASFVARFRKAAQ